jgi:hypothetical protein
LEVLFCAHFGPWEDHEYFLGDPCFCFSLEVLVDGMDFDYFHAVDALGVWLFFLIRQQDCDFDPLLVVVS